MGDLYWVPGTRLTPVRSRRLSKSEEILPLASTWSVLIFCHDDDDDWWSVHTFKVKMNFHDHDDNAQEGATRILQTAKSVFGPGHAAK